MNLDKLLEITKENYYLHETTYLRHIPEASFRKKLVQYYNHELEEVRIMGTVLNAIYTEGKTTFYFSKRSLAKLIEEDKKNLEGKGRPKIELGKNGYKINFFRQKLMEMFKNVDAFSVLKEASVKFKTPAVVEFDDDDMYELMDEYGTVSKRLRKSWKKAALDSINLIESEMIEIDAEIALETISSPENKHVAVSKSKPILESSSNDLEVDLSMDEDDDCYFLSIMNK